MKRILIGLIRFYQKYISSATSPCCRFSPTCSQYGIEVIDRFGAVKGSFMTLWRILRCNPMIPGGYDPVPEVEPSRVYFKKRRGGFNDFNAIDYAAVKNRKNSQTKQ